jgi:hypothetical protein
MWEARKPVGIVNRMRYYNKDWKLGGKVFFVQFDKHMERYMRLEYGRNIGERLWMDNLTYQYRKEQED